MPVSPYSGSGVVAWAAPGVVHEVSPVGGALFEQIAEEHDWQIVAKEVTKLFFNSVLGPGRCTLCR